MPEGDSSGPTKTTIVTISSGNSYFLPASINERRIDLLVDTGSAFSILRKDTWDRLFPKGKDLTPSSRNFVGVDGNPLNVQGSCQVPIVIRGKTFAIEVYVIDGITAEAILGLNVLEKNNACIDSAAGRLTIPGAEVVAELKKERGASLPHEYPAIQQIDLCVQNTLTVPRWSEVEIETSPAQELPEGTWLVESQTKSKHPLLVARSLIHSTSACPVRIMNLSKEDVTVYGGSKVAVASPIGESNIYSGNQANIHAVSEFLTQDVKTSLQEAYNNVQRNFQLKQSRQKEFYDQRIHGKPFDKDTVVWLHSTVIPRGCSRKFHHPWTGPYRVIKRISDVTYCIQSVGGRRKRLVVHFDRLKPCDPNTRFDHHGHAPSGQEDNNPPHSPPVADPPVTFGRELQLLDHSTSDSPDQVRRYPECRHQHPDRYGVSIRH